MTAATISDIATKAVQAVNDIKAVERERIAAAITIEPAAVPEPPEVLASSWSPDGFTGWETGYRFGRDAERSRILAIVIADPETT